MPKVQEIMCTKVITVSPETTVAEAIELLLKHRISGAPVVDEAGNLIGVVSEFRLMEVVYRPQVKSDLVSQVMTRDVLTVTEQTELADVANKFLSHRIRRMPVVRGRQLVGVIARSDVLRSAMRDTNAATTSYADLPARATA